MAEAPHSHALRRGRFSEAGRVYLVTTSTDRRRPLFSNLYFGRAVVAALRHETHCVETLAFVVMPDHLHWLLRLGERATLDRAVRNAKSFSARGINELAGTEGRVWQPGFHDHGIRRDEDLAKVARYVVANPLRAGLVRRIGDYSLWDAAWI